MSSVRRRLLCFVLLATFAAPAWAHGEQMFYYLGTYALVVMGTCMAVVLATPLRKRLTGGILGCLAGVAVPWAVVFLAPAMDGRAMLVAMLILPVVGAVVGVIVQGRLARK
jgi:hypothetical protein